MPTVRCRMTDCVHWDEEYCSASRISIDEEGICLTYAAYEEDIDGFGSGADWEDDVGEDVLDELDGEFDDDDENDVVIRGRRRWHDW